MIDAKIEINITDLIKMPLKQRLEYLRMVDIFGVIPYDNNYKLKNYIEQATAYVGQIEKIKPIVIKDGITKVADIIRQNFPCVVQLMQLHTTICN